MNERSLGSKTPFKDLAYLLEGTTELGITADDIYLCERANEFIMDDVCLDCSQCQYNPRKPSPPRPMPRPKPRPEDMGVMGFGYEDKYGE